MTQDGYSGGQPDPSAAGTGSPAPGWEQIPGSAPATGLGDWQSSGKSRRGLILGVAGGCLVLLLVVVLIVVFVVVRTQRAAEREAAEREAAILAPAQGYLEALAAGDAEQALTYLDPESADLEGPLLTADVLGASLEQAPISDISVAAAEEYEEVASRYDVTVSYLLGEESVSETWYVSPSEDGSSFLLEDGTATVSADGLEGMTHVEIAGVPVEDTEEFTVFPGVYTAALPGDRLVLEGSTTVTVASPGASADFEDTTVATTAEGQEYARGLVQAAVEDCVASTNLEAGCGLDQPETLSDGTVLTEGSLERTLSDSATKALEEMTFELGPGGPTVVYGEDVGAVEVLAEGTRDGQTGGGEITGGGTSIGTPTMDLGEEEPTVSFT